MSNFLVRLLTSIVFVASIVFFTYSGRMEMSILFGICALLAYWEFISLPQENPIPMLVKILSMGSAILVYMVVSHVLIGLMDWNMVLWCLLLAPLYMIIMLFSKNDPIQNGAFPILGLVYIIVPFALLADLGTHHGLYIFELILFPLILLWIYDTGAYLIGSRIGKNKMFVSVSPLKSWEGAIGGAVLAIGSAVLFSNWISYYNIVEWLGLGLIVVVFGTLGDFAESKLKRHFGVKDSGNILPGHGGMFDRFDAWILILPPLYIFKTIILS